MKKKLSFLFLICILSALSINATVYSGSCGTNVKYSLATSTGVLKITGTGAMTNYSSSSAPWNSMSYVKTVEISDGVTSIGDEAFYGCSKLTSITIPNSVTSIGESVFYGCSGLTSIEIPNSVTGIGSSAFYNCSSLTSVTIPNSVTSVGKDAFKNCSSLQKVIVSDIAAWCGISFGNASGNPLYYAKHLYRNESTEIKDLVIPNSVTSIKFAVFYGCSSLTSVTIPNSVTSIRKSAFCYCSGLTSVTIGNSVTSIGDYAFQYCSGLTSITIPNSVKSIGNYAFQYCSGLTSVTIPNSVTSIGSYAFSGTAWYNNQPDGLVYAGLVAYKYKGTMPANTSITIKEGTLGIASSAFEDCSGLTSITIPNSVTSIGSNAFYGCSGLTSVTIPNSVTSIGKGAFEDCSGLTSVISEIEEPFAFGTNAFSDIEFSCALTVPYGTRDAYIAAGWTTDVFKGGIEEIEIISGSCGENVNYSLNLETGVLSITGTGAMTDYSNEEDVPWYKQRGNIKSVEIADGVTTIGSKVFSFTGFSSIKIPNSVISIGTEAFDRCALTSIDIPNSVTSIGDYAFYNCDSLTSVTIPNSVTNIGNDTFNSCENLTRVSINSNTIIGTDDISLYGVFGSQVKEYILGNDVKSIGGGKFSGCTGLAYITIPNSVKTIGNSAFHNCSKLEYITIPNSVTSIGDYALSSCENLKSVTIGSGVQVIGKDVFENHRPAKVFWLTNTPPEGYTYAEGTINYVSNRQYTEFSNVIRYSSLSSIFVVDGIKYVPVSPSERTCDAIDCTYDESIETINIGEKITNRGIALSVKQVCPYTCFDNKYIKEINLSFKGDIGANAFYGCSNMTKAELGDNILSIGESGFSKCSKLESIVIPDSVVSINDSTFCDCIALDAVKIGKKVENIGRYAFSGCSVLPNIKIPQSVASIADYAFRGCIGMKTVVMSNGDSELALSSNGSNPLFADCPLDSVYIGRNILYETSADYGYSPFYRNKTLRTVVITDMETEISENEFYGCTNLQSFKVGDGVTYFGSWAFSGCSSLKSLSFGSQLRIIGQEAFSDCNSVTVIVSKTERPPICDNQALEDINKWDCKLYVPEGTLSAYQAANQWKDFFFIEEGDPFAILRGDVNGDGEVNVGDLVSVSNYMAGDGSVSKDAADVNEDGEVNVGDMVVISNIMSGNE